MRQFNEHDADDIKELKKLNTESWMLELLKKNPPYVSWGNYEDCMISDSQWGGSVELEHVSDLWNLDDYNELINFYFQVVRDDVECIDCKGTGLNDGTRKISDDWYDFKHTGRKWCDNITQDEVDVLWTENRLHDFKTKPTAEEVNEWSKKTMGHDSINQWICVETRAKREGVFGYCSKCDGDGSIFTEAKAHLALQMWFIHPRKGSSRGVYLKNIKENEVDTVLKYLKEARDRNIDRFSKL